MKTKLLTILGALLVVCSSAMAQDKNTSPTGAKAAGEKPAGVCDCNMSSEGLHKKNEHSNLMPDSTSSSPQGQGSSDSSGTDGVK